MYLCDFISIGGIRHYATAGLSTGKIKCERVTHEAFKQFIRNVLTMGDPIELESGEKEMSA